LEQRFAAAEPDLPSINQVKSAKTKNQYNKKQMKISKYILAGLLATGLATAANAQTIVRFTGSTAYQSQTTAAIKAAYGGAGHYTCVYDNLASSTAETNASYVLFSGTIGGNLVYIKGSWSGSEAGIQTVSQIQVSPAVSGTGVAIPFLPTSALTGVTVNTTAVTPAATANEVPDVALSDTWQSTSQYASTAAISVGGTTWNYAPLTGANSYSDGIVGVVTFAWVASNHGNIGSSGTITNITNQQAQALYTVSKLGQGGSLPLGFFTGNSADNTYNVYPIGRNPDSGTRLSTFAETGLGAVTTVTQFQPQDSANALVTATSQAISKIVLWPLDTVNGIPVVKANSGYDSTTKQLGAISQDCSSIATPQGTGAILVTYMSNGSAGTASTSPAAGRKLTYNGIAPGNAAVQNGLYSFWAYEHMYYRAGSAVSSIADAVAAQIHDTTASITPGSMNVSRTTDGYKIVAGNSY
jgi:hypothetical protein